MAKTKTRSNLAPVKASDVVRQPILGTFDGLSLDADITNNNGLDIPRDVWDVVFASEEYKNGIKNGWFIGFLGHPEDPGCQDFKNGCIVMTEGHMDNGKIIASFNLIDTPVGRIVKTFHDAGVKFGISVRGAGDITNHVVDAETFVFRGFDLVAFPAYDEAVPEFTALAASTDPESRRAYKTVCDTINTELTGITSTSAIKEIEKPFHKKSNLYKSLKSREDEIVSTEDSESVEEVEGEPVSGSEAGEGEMGKSSNLGAFGANMTQLVNCQKIDAMTNLYIAACQENKTLRGELDKVSIEASRKLRTVERMTTQQLNDVKATTETQQHTINGLTKEVAGLKSQVAASNRLNLDYKRKVEAAKATNEDLQQRVRETVTASRHDQSSASKLLSQVKALTAQLLETKQAYATLYAGAVGVNPSSLTITASTSVKQIREQISGATNTVGIPAAPDFDTEMLEPVIDDDDLAVL